MSRKEGSEYGEIFAGIGLFLGVLFLSQFAFSDKQRKAIIERDGNACQATVKHRCNKQDGLEVDHIMPQRYAAEFGIDADYPENALSKCKNAHNIKHPDRVATLQHYHEDKANGIDSFGKMFEERKQKLDAKVIYWNPDNDRTDAVRAVQLTQRAKAKGWEFPAVHHREPKNS